MAAGLVSGFLVEDEGQGRGGGGERWCVQEQHGLGGACVSATLPPHTWWQHQVSDASNSGSGADCP